MLTPGTTAPVRIEVEVCVVGGGFAGLCAALRLQDVGCPVIVLEARDRVGGRVLTQYDTAARWLDVGGQWVGGSQTEFLKLIDRCGCATYPTEAEGFVRVRGVDEAETLVNSDLDWNHVQGIEKVEAAMNLLEAIVDEIDPKAPWAHPDAERLDHTTFRAWLNANVPDRRVREFLEADLSYACAAPDEISVLALLAIVKQCGGFDALDKDAQETRIVEGAQRVAVRLAERVLKPNTVLYGQPVERIYWEEGGGVILCSPGYDVYAKRAIITAPPAVVKEIAFQPPLPLWRRELLEDWPQGTVIKVGMVFEEPFWRREGRSGLSLDWRALAVETADSSPTPEASGCGTLTAFVYTTKANSIKGLPAPERRRRILEDLVERFGERVKHPMEYEETFWTDEKYTKGCYGAFLRPGATTKYKATIRERVGPIHWAGSETSPVWPTFIEGAVRSGYRAAQEILDARNAVASA